MSKKQRIDELEKRVKALENPPRYIEHLGAVPMHRMKNPIPLPEKLSFGDEPRCFEGESSVSDVVIIVGAALFLLVIGFGLGCLGSML